MGRKCCYVAPSESKLHGCGACRGKCTANHRTACNEVPAQTAQKGMDLHNNVTHREFNSKFHCDSSISMSGSTLQLPRGTVLDWNDCSAVTRSPSVSELLESNKNMSPLPSYSLKMGPAQNHWRSSPFACNLLSKHRCALINNGHIQGA